MPKQGLSIIEIIVSLVILALTLVGLVNIFVSGQRWVIHTRSRISGIELGRVFVDPLQMDVRADTWNAVGNQLTVHPAQSGAANTVGTIQYTPNFTVSDVQIGGVNTGARRVTVILNWNEHTPQ